MAKMEWKQWHFYAFPICFCQVLGWTEALGVVVDAKLSHRGFLAVHEAPHRATHVVSWPLATGGECFAVLPNERNHHTEARREPCAGSHRRACGTYIDVKVRCRGFTAINFLAFPSKTMANVSGAAAAWL